MGRMVVAAFRPKPGMDQQLRKVVERHWRVLDEQGLVTQRPRQVMLATDGTVVEVFEWRSAQAVDEAHRNPAVQALWADFEAVCEYVPLSALPEAQHPFSEFVALDMS